MLFFDLSILLLLDLVGLSLFLELSFLSFDFDLFYLELFLLYCYISAVELFIIWFLDLNFYYWVLIVG